MILYNSSPPYIFEVFHFRRVYIQYTHQSLIVLMIYNYK